MVLCQIEVQDTALALPARKMYFCGLSGKYKARLVNIAWHDSANASGRLIKIRSDSFRLPYGSSNSLMFCTNNSKNSSNPQGAWTFTIEATGNSIDLEFVTDVPYDGTAGNAFDFAVLSFEVERIENDK